MNKVPMTSIGAELLKKELHQLKSIARPKIVHAIAEARAHGDLKENAEYHAAKEQQGLAEARIRDIEHKLAHAQIIDVTQLTPTGRVVFGVTVQLINLETDEEVVYTIVGEDEAAVKDAKISFSSPIARALIGKQEGDEVDVKTPAGAVCYEIIAVKYLLVVFH